LDKLFEQPMFFEALYPRMIEETGLPAGFPEYADAEAEATVNKQYENFVITGLLQTEDYARALLRAGQRPEKLERLVAARMQRQDVLKREDPPVLIAVLDVAAVRRSFGGREVMKTQMKHLLNRAQEPNIQIHVVPDDAEICPEAPFALLGFPGEPDVAYSEMAGGRGILIDDSAYVAELGILFELIRSKALNAEDSATFIQTALEHL
jgi:uncharacterized protein DUF5753